MQPFGHQERIADKEHRNVGSFRIDVCPSIAIQRAQMGHGLRLKLKLEAIC